MARFGDETLKKKKKPEVNRTEGQTFQIGDKKFESREAYNEAKKKLSFEAEKKAASLQQQRFQAQTAEAQQVVEQQADLEQRRAEAKQVFQEKGILEEQARRPERTELDIEREGVAKTPVFGASISALQGGMVEMAKKGQLGIFEAGEGTEIEPLIQDPETAREVALQEIQQDVINKGTSISEKFGALIEAIPIAGGLISKYAGGLVEAPASNVNTIVSEIKSITTQASNMREKAATGKLGDPYVAIEQLEIYEEDVARLEQRIKLLSLQSASLIADADSLNKIESEILDSKRRIFDAKQAAAAGAIAPATDSNIFLTLRELKGG